MTKRTDLAMEARELWQESAEKTTRLPGVRARERREAGYPVTQVDILDQAGADALGKPVGRYLTVDLSAFRKRGHGFFDRAVRAVGVQLRELLPETGEALVVGLGNPAMTADAVGPLTLDQLLITRHLRSAMPREFAGFRSVAALRTGVLGTTGLESAEAVRAVTAALQPAMVIAVDALAARRAERLCTTVQLSNTGIAPGSGVGNHRAALDRETLGVPVFSIGVPTVVDAGTLCADLLGRAGPEQQQAGLLVTPGDIDAQVRDLAKVVGYALNWALHDLEVADISALLS